MTKAQQKRILEFVVDARERIANLGESMECHDEHPLSDLINENLDHIYAELQRIEFFVKDGK